MLTTRVLWDIKYIHHNLDTDIFINNSVLMASKHFVRLDSCTLPLPVCQDYSKQLASIDNDPLVGPSSTIAYYLLNKYSTSRRRWYIAA